MQFSPASCHFIPLRSKYSPKNPVVKHPRTMIFLQRERPSFTHTHTHLQLQLYLTILHDQRVPYGPVHGCLPVCLSQFFKDAGNSLEQGYFCTATKHRYSRV
jgi:hypothetical protein